MFFLSSFSKLQLDIAGFLAILGDGSILRNADVLACESLSVVLPRLLPAPQALLRHGRPSRLETKEGTVIGINSGNVRYQVNFFGNIIHYDHLEQYEVRCVRVTRKKEAASSLEEQQTRRPVEPYKHGFLFALTVLGSIMSVIIIVISVVHNDGMALLATIALSFVSSLAGLGSYWTLRLPSPPHRPNAVLPPGNVVIYYPNGGILIALCDEQVSRLYFAAESCDYLVDDTTYRVIALFATILLMFSVVFLSSAKLFQQLLFVGAYIILNACYWLVAALSPEKHHWIHPYEVEMLHYEVPSANNQTAATPNRGQQKSPRLLKGRVRKFVDRCECKLGIKPTEDLPPNLVSASYTEALWRAVALTKSKDWISQAPEVVPRSKAWNKWLEMAEDAARSGDRFKEIAVEVDDQGQILKTRKVMILPEWNWNKALSECLANPEKEEKPKDSGSNDSIKT